MATSNVSSHRASVHTHEGGRAVHNVTPLAELRRSTLAALLFEDLFYESGGAHAKRVADLVAQCKPEDVAKLAVEARERMHLRHMPLFLVRELARRAERNQPKSTIGATIRQTLASVIQRPDEITEYLAIYWRERKGRRDKAATISNASRRGLADAFRKFNRYALAKYRGDDKAVKLVDALRLVRPKPRDAEQAALWKELRAGTLKSEDTWESELSAGKDKRETWERLIRDKKLGGLAFLRNLRNMAEAKVDRTLILEALKSHPFTRVLPFRFLAAAPYAPGLVAELGDAMERAMNANAPTLLGRTIVLVDVSGSMDNALSAKSDLKRLDAACGVAILARSRCADAGIYTFSNALAHLPSYRGIALKDAIVNSQPHGSTMLGAAIARLNEIETYDRLIVVTDEQSHDSVGAPKAGATGYMVNVAAYSHGVGFGPWVRVDGFSERVLDFVEEVEQPAQ
jgi:hypothetical protein